MSLPANVRDAILAMGPGAEPELNKKTKAMFAPLITPGEEVETRLDSAFDRCWGVIVWNDPINTMTYVTYVFEKVLKLARPVAEKHMMEVNDSAGRQAEEAPDLDHVHEAAAHVHEPRDERRRAGQRRAVGEGQDL